MVLTAMTCPVLTCKEKDAEISHNITVHSRNHCAAYSCVSCAARKAQVPYYIVTCGLSDNILPPYLINKTISYTKSVFIFPTNV